MSLIPPKPEKSPATVSRTETSSGLPRPLLIAHRCGAGLGPENTCGAVVQSSFFRPDFYEIDVRHTADGIAICMHDEILNRTTNAENLPDDLRLHSLDVSECTLAEIERLDAGSRFDSTFTNERVPTFERMLDCVNPSPLAIELKEPEITPDECAAISQLLEDRGDVSSIVLSFHKSALDTFREIDSARRTGYITIAMDEYAIEGPHQVIALLASACTLEIVDQIHEAGKAVWVWTVNEGFEEYIEMGVDGIATNHSDRLRAALPPS